MRRTALLAVLVTLVMVPAAASAQAGKPLKYTQEFNGFTQPFSGCGFVGVQTTDLTFTSWTHFDKDGNVARIREHVAVRTSTWTNPENGRVLSSTGGAFTQTKDLSEPFVTTHTGQVAAVTIPGEGVVLLDAGRLIFNPFEWLFIAGHHEVFFGPFIGAPPPEAFCAYLVG